MRKTIGFASLIIFIGSIILLGFFKWKTSEFLSETSFVYKYWWFAVLLFFSYLGMRWGFSKERE